MEVATLPSATQTHLEGQTCGTLLKRAAGFYWQGRLSIIRNTESPTKPLTEEQYESPFGIQWMVSKLLGHGSIETLERENAKWVKSTQDRVNTLAEGIAACRSRPSPRRDRRLPT